jgi:hypothetical protein
MGKSLLIAACAVAIAIPVAVSAQTSPGPAGLGRAPGGPDGRTSQGRSPSTTSSVGILTGSERPRFREFAIREQKQGFRAQTDVKVGTLVPENISLFEVPMEYGAAQYRYTVLNHRPVLVDPNTRAIVEVVE